MTDRLYNFNSINLDHYPSVPQDADILIIASPKSELSPKTYSAIDAYLKNGGSTLYMLDRYTVPSINYILQKSGFAFLPNVAVDPTRTAPQSGEFSIIPILSPISEITTLLISKRQSVIFPSASIVNIIPPDFQDSEYTYDISPLARMSQHGYGETEFSQGLYNKDANDITGYYCLALSSTVAALDGCIRAAGNLHQEGVLMERKKQSKMLLRLMQKVDSSCRCNVCKIWFKPRAETPTIC